MESPQKLKIDLSYDPTNLLLSIHQKENNHYLQEISALPCSLQHYSKEPQYRNNFSVCRWMDEENGVCVSISCCGSGAIFERRNE